MKKLQDYLITIDVNDDVLSQWDIKKAYRDGQHVGYVIIKGCEIHMLSTNENKAMSRKNIKEFIEPLIESYGYCTTRVPIAETDHKLREVLGFEHGWSDENFSYWSLTKVPFQKEKTCN